MKKIKQILPKGTVKEFRELANAVDRAVKAANDFNQALYLNWKIGFKPQSQRIIWILPLLTILFGLAVIAWYVLVRF